MNEITMYKDPYVNQYSAPYGYCFFKDGKKLGRIIWVNDADGICIGKCEKEWGL